MTTITKASATKAVTISATTPIWVLAMLREFGFDPVEGEEYRVTVKRVKK